MPDQRISELTSGTAPQATDEMPLRRGAANVKLTVAQLLTPGRVTFNKAAYTIPNDAAYVAQVGTFTPGTDAGGARVVTLPNASTFGAGKLLLIADESFSVRPWYRSEALVPTCMTRWVAGINRNMFLDRVRYQFRLADVANRLY